MMNSKDTANDKKAIAHVIRIVDDYTLIIDAGTNQGLKIGDKVQVYDILDEIFDLEGGVIDYYRFIKATLRVDVCEDKYSICKTLSSSVPSAYKLVAQLATSPLLETKTLREKLQVEESDQKPLPVGERRIEIGDKVKKA